MNPYFYLIILALYVGSVAGGYFFGRSDGRDLERAKQAEVQEIVDRVKTAALEGAAEEIAKIEVKHVTIRQQLEKEVIEKPVYRECRHTPDGLRAINQALTNGEELPAGSLVPSPKPPGG